mgnify:CR=1 FL=1
MIDTKENVLDELYWDARPKPSSLARRLHGMQSRKYTSEARTLLGRFPDATIQPHGVISDNNWPPLSKEEELLLHEATLELAKLGVAASAGDKDRRLDMLVSSANEALSTRGLLESRCIEWAGLFLPELDLDSKRGEIPSCIEDSQSFVELSEKFGFSEIDHTPSDLEWSAIKSQATSLLHISQTVSEHEDAIRELAESYFPCLSSLMGPLSASKLIVLAGSRERLARMPSGSLQVLGASAAMSAHRRGAPPPKHGSILFSMPQVSRSPRWVRGKIARFLAGKASIATRIDHFGGDPWDKEEIEKINGQIEKIKLKFPNPPKRR